MRIAIPLAGDRLAQHFGHCAKFALIDVDRTAKKIIASTQVDAPEHQPGLLPPWLRGQGVDLVIAGGIGSRALALFQAASIDVVTGAPADPIQDLVERFLDGTLAAGENICDH